jgi:hypothetical protein
MKNNVVLPDNIKILHNNQDNIENKLGLTLDKIIKEFKAGINPDKDNTALRMEIAKKIKKMYMQEYLIGLRTNKKLIENYIDEKFNSGN